MNESMDHAQAIRGVLDTIDLIAASPQISEDELVHSLEAQGYTTTQAEKLIAFVPSAFSWALLKRMGLESFPSNYLVISEAGREIPLPIATEHFFTAALHLAYSTLEEGWSEKLSRSTFEATISRSAEMSAANQLLNAGHSVTEAKLLPLRVSRLKEYDAK